jgi:REP element-mobilizing transposase RayT
MAKLDHYHTKFEEEKFYHVYNRTVNKDPMFLNANNYIFFLSKLDLYLSPVLDIYAYCLLNNHFHLLVKIKPLEALTTCEKLSKLTSHTSVHAIVCHQFRKFFQSYVMAFNKQQDRTGTLFQTPFKRASVKSEDYFTKLVYYIHANPQLHGFTKDFREWRWSSYCKILSIKPSKLRKKEVIDWFMGVDNYVNYHSLLHKDILEEIV